MKPSLLILLLPISYLINILIVGAALPASLNLLSLCGLAAFFLYMDQTSEKLQKDAFEKFEAKVQKEQEARFVEMYQKVEAQHKAMNDEINKTFMTSHGKGALFNKEKIRF